MSFTENDRKFRPKIGNVFPADGGDGGGSFASVIAAALAAEFSDTPAAVKSVARLTGANERAVRDWFDGKNGPSGDNLMSLMRHSERVLSAVLGLAGRSELSAVADLIALRAHVAAMVDGIDALLASRARR